MIPVIFSIIFLNVKSLQQFEVSFEEASVFKYIGFAIISFSFILFLKTNLDLQEVDKMFDTLQKRDALTSPRLPGIEDYNNEKFVEFLNSLSSDYIGVYFNEKLLVFNKKEEVFSNPLKLDNLKNVMPFNISVKIDSTNKRTQVMDKGTEHTQGLVSDCTFISSDSVSVISDIIS